MKRVEKIFGVIYGVFMGRVFVSQDVQGVRELRIFCILQKVFFFVICVYYLVRILDVLVYGKGQRFSIVLLVKVLVNNWNYYLLI